MLTDEPAMGIESYWRGRPVSRVELSLAPGDVALASAALERPDDELEVIVSISRPDGVLIVSATPRGCVGTLQPDADADWLQLVGDGRRDWADEVEVVLGGQLVGWSLRYFVPVGSARQVVEHFAAFGPPLPGCWEDPAHHQARPFRAAVLRPVAGPLPGLQRRLATDGREPERTPARRVSSPPSSHPWSSSYAAVGRPTRWRGCRGERGSRFRPRYPGGRRRPRTERGAVPADHADAAGRPAAKGPDLGCSRIIWGLGVGFVAAGVHPT